MSVARARYRRGGRRPPERSRPSPARDLGVLSAIGIRSGRGSSSAPKVAIIGTGAILLPAGTRPRRERIAGPPNRDNGRPGRPAMATSRTVSGPLPDTQGGDPLRRSSKRGKPTTSSYLCGSSTAAAHDAGSHRALGELGSWGRGDRPASPTGLGFSKIGPSSCGGNPVSCFDATILRRRPQSVGRSGRSP